MTIQVLTQDARNTLAVGRRHLWGFRVYGQPGPLSEPKYSEGWWYIPTDDSIQYQKAIKRIEAIKKAGIPIQQIIVTHETPKLLCAPKPKPTKSPFPIVTTIVAVFTASLVAVVAVIGVVSLMVAVIGMLLPLLGAVVLISMMGLGLLIDPCVIVVLNDGSWVEVLRWVD